METPTKHEQFRVIKCAFRKYTTLSAGTASVSGQQTVFDGASNHKRSSMGRVIAVPGRGVLSLWSFSAIPAVNHVSQKELYITRKDRKSTRLNSSHVASSYAVFCLTKKK